MATISFLVNGTATNQTKPVAWITIEEIEGGLLFFKVKQIGDIMGDLHGIYFDITDESIRNTLRVTAVSSGIRTTEDSVSCLKTGTHVSKARTDSKVFASDRAATGKSSISKNEISSYSFILRSKTRALSLCDFSHIQLDYFEDHDDISAVDNDDNSHRWLYMGLL